MDKFKAKHSNYEETIKSLDVIKIQKMLNSLLEELIEVNQLAKEKVDTSSNVIDDFYSDLLRTLEEVKVGKCIKNPTQSQVLKMKRDYALSNLN